MPSVGNTSSKGGGAVYEPSAMAVAPESLNSSTFQMEGRSRCVPQGTSVASILAPIVAKGTPTPGSNSWPSSRPPSARPPESRWALGRKDEAVAVFAEVLSAVAAYRFFRVVADEGAAVEPVLKSLADRLARGAWRHPRHGRRAASARS